MRNYTRGLKKRATSGNLFYLAGETDIDLVHAGAGDDTFTNEIRKRRMHGRKKRKALKERA